MFMQNVIKLKKSGQFEQEFRLKLDPRSLTPTVQCSLAMRILFRFCFAYLILFSLVKKHLFRFKRSRCNHPNLLSVGLVNADTPVPFADFPKLKNRACTENRDESGINLTANGSSNDSSISRCVKEPLKSKDGLFQSNSMAGVNCKSIAHAM